MCSWMPLCPHVPRAPSECSSSISIPAAPGSACGAISQAIADPDDAEVLEALEDHIRQCLAESGAEAFLRSLEDSALQHAARQPSGRAVSGGCLLARARPSLSRARRSSTGAAVPHPPAALFSLRAAAGGLGDEMQSEAEDWVPAPEGHAALARISSWPTWRAGPWNRAFPMAV